MWKLNLDDSPENSKKAPPLESTAGRASLSDITNRPHVHHTAQYDVETYAASAKVTETDAWISAESVRDVRGGARRNVECFCGGAGYSQCCFAKLVPLCLWKIVAIMN